MKRIQAISPEGSPSVTFVIAESDRERRKLEIAARQGKVDPGRENRDAPSKRTGKG